MAKAAVTDYWLEKLRLQAEGLISLKYLKSRFLGLSRCHPIFWTCGSSPWEVDKATTQAQLLSGRYRLESLTSHWVPRECAPCLTVRRLQLHTRELSSHFCWTVPPSPVLGKS